MMIHTITVDNSYYGDDEEYGPRTFEIDMPDRIYLQVVEEEDGTPANDEWWTFAQQRVYESDVPYVPLAHLEEAEAERDALRAEIERLQKWIDTEGWRPLPPPPTEEGTATVD